MWRKLPVRRSTPSGNTALREKLHDLSPAEVQLGLADSRSDAH